MTDRTLRHEELAEEPRWLSEWRVRPLEQKAALARFDELVGLPPRDLAGVWHGATLPTGHPLDGVLEILGWYGKCFENEDCVHPLLFSSPAGGIISIDPARLPFRAALRWPGLTRSPAARMAFSVLLSVLKTREPTAYLRCVPFRGAASAAMIYVRQPITDHFRRVDAGRVLGLMEARDMAPYFFLLSRRRHGHHQFSANLAVAP